MPILDASMRPGANRRDQSARSCMPRRASAGFNEARRESPGSVEPLAQPMRRLKEASMRPGANRRDQNQPCHEYGIKPIKLQ